MKKKYKLKKKKDKYKDAYDLKCAEILSYKIILANIMKRCIPEYEHCTIESIVNEYIEADHKTNNEKILGLKQDFKHLTYDVFFSSALPNSEESIGMFINLEPQKTSKHLEYNVFNRGLFYAAKAITYQYNTVFKKSLYDLIKKVYSVFICFDAPTKEEENSIAYFHLTKDIKIGYNMYEAYDKMCVIVIYMGENTSQHELLRLIEVLFTSELNSNEIVETLNEEYGISLSEPFVAEVDEMCNLSDRIEERGIKKGIKKGKELGKIEGIEQGKIESSYSSAINIMNNLSMSFEDALAIINPSTEIMEACRQKYKLEVSGQ